MPTATTPIMRVLFSICFCLSLLVFGVRAQEVVPPPGPDQAEEVVRVSTELVQTDVMVFDKQGRFVDGLGREQFELRVDGRPQAISFFERVTSGSINEETQLAAARGGLGTRPSAKNSGAVRPLDRSRTILFFVDDLHLAPDSIARARDTLVRFIREEMGQNDEAVVISASGQVGFLQQLTSDKMVLRAAIARLNYRANNVRDFDRPPMSEFQAIAIDRRDPNVFDYFIEQLMRDTPGLRRTAAESLVTNRANNLIRQGSAITTNTLATLENVVRSSATLTGRKLVLFISDGFFLNSRDSNVRDRLRRITDAAARSGVVIYAMDARGLTSGLPDASSDSGFDLTGRLQAASAGETSALQDPLFTLAADTGGRALVNTNALNAAFTKALAETSAYYLIAWRPERVDERQPKFRRIELSVTGRRDLTVLVRRGFYDTPPKPTPTASKDAKDNPPTKSPDAELFSALRSSIPVNALPTSLSIGYVNTPDAGMLLTASIGISAEALDLAAGGKQSAKADVIGGVYDDRGKLVYNFKQQLTVVPDVINRAAPGAERRHILYSEQTRVAPGLYQVRVATRDTRNGRTGSAMQWIEIPDIATGRFTLGSIFVGERTQNAAKTEKAEEQQVQISADRRFARNSWLRFLTNIYNAARGSGSGTAAAPDIALQVQVFRDDQPVVTMPLRKVSTEGIADRARIPYAAELFLEGLPAGRYILQVTAIDRLAKTNSTQRINFFIE